MKMGNAISGLSASSYLSSGVPQRSVPEPIFSSVYIAPIGMTAAYYGLSQQEDADDTHLFISFCPTKYHYVFVAARDLPIAFTPLALSE
jgi:hypothetical protein